MYYSIINGTGRTFRFSMYPFYHSKKSHNKKDQFIQLSNWPNQYLRRLLEIQSLLPFRIKITKFPIALYEIQIPGLYSTCQFWIYYYISETEITDNVNLFFHKHSVPLEHSLSLLFIHSFIHSLSLSHKQTSLSLPLLHVRYQQYIRRKNNKPVCLESHIPQWNSITQLSAYLHIWSNSPFSPFSLPRPQHSN